MALPNTPAPHDRQRFAPDRPVPEETATSGNPRTNPGMHLADASKPPLFCRFGSSSLHQRDSRSALFEGYTGSGSGGRPVSTSPSRAGGYGYGYPGANGGAAAAPGGHLGVEKRGFRPATPNSRYVVAGSCSAIVVVKGGFC